MGRKGFADIRFEDMERLRDRECRGVGHTAPANRGHSLNTSPSLQKVPALNQSLDAARRHCHP